MSKLESILEVYEGGRKLPVLEYYYTIQGEGFHAGKAVFFVRLSGCNVFCPWCDTKQSWVPHLEQLMEVQKIVEMAESFPAHSLLVTGGEPVLYNLSFLTEEAKRRGIKTFLETSGTGQITGSWDWICVSPKKYLKPIDSSIERANELKFIIADEEDFEFAESYVKKITNDVYLFLQPEWSRRHEILPKIVEYVKQRPYWRISLQIHKYMGIP